MAFMLGMIFAATLFSIATVIVVLLVPLNRPSSGGAVS